MVTSAFVLFRVYSRRLIISGLVTPTFCQLEECLHPSLNILHMVLPFFTYLGYV